MTQQRCPVCGGLPTLVFSSTVLARHPADFISCPDCELLQAAEPGWLDEAYAVPMSAIDTGVLARNWSVAQRLGCLFGAWFGDGAQFADLAGGHGLLTRLMRDKGLDYYWSDPYTDNQFARGFELEKGRTVVGVSAIEVLEHVPDPLSFLRACFAETGAQAVVFSTELFAGPPPARDWWYYQLETGQHITFMTRRTLEVIAEALGCRLYSRASFHALTLSDLPAWPFNIATSPARRLFHPWQSRTWKPLTQADSEIAKRNVRGGPGRQITWPTADRELP